MSETKKPIEERLRDAGQGREVWRVQDKASKGYCMQFELWEEYEAREWWREYTERYIADKKELAKVRIQSQKDSLMVEAADQIEKLRNAIMFCSGSCHGVLEEKQVS